MSLMDEIKNCGCESNAPQLIEAEMHRLQAEDDSKCDLEFYREAAEINITGISGKDARDQWYVYSQEWEKHILMGDAEWY
jgi:hypothetical protein